jgi:hypothetical protein
MCAPTGAILMNTFGDKLLKKDTEAGEGDHEKGAHTPKASGAIQNEVEMPLY